MVARGESAGVLCFASSRPQRRITLGQVKALNIVASTAGSALAAAILWEQLRTANRELEQRVRDRTSQLEAANQELEAFSFSVSHDLRAPLRIVEGYCDLIRRDYGALVPSTARELLDEVCTGTRRMGQLIEDLLTFSRFARQPLEKQRLRPAEILASALRQVRAEVEARAVEVQVGELHECSGDAALLEQVMVNLLSNALKFTRGRARAHITVGSFERDGGQVYFVRDNGVGFDMKHAAKLFGAFQRLHAQGDFEGTGIGLSIVHRIIQRHGGRIWAESRPDEGATFYFTLPP
jgi:light-regulated signal transduction histidine kinase (bacteriophytochrome)